MKHTIQLWFHVDSPCLANPQPHPSRPLQKRPGWLLLGPVPPGLAGWSTSKNCQTCINMGFTPKHRGSTSKKSRDNGITTNQSGDLVSFVVIFWDGQWFCQQHGGQAWTGSRPYKPIYFLFWSIRKLFIYPIKVDTGLHGALIDWLIFGTMWCHFFSAQFWWGSLTPQKSLWDIPSPMLGNSSTWTNINQNPGENYDHHNSCVIPSLVYYSSWIHHQYTTGSWWLTNTNHHHSFKSDWSDSSKLFDNWKFPKAISAHSSVYVHIHNYICTYLTLYPSQTLLVFAFFLRIYIYIIYSNYIYMWK
jgi:hypothetical protein